MVGKTNMDQFAAGLVGTRTPFGIAPNCFDSRCGFGLAACDPVGRSGLLHLCELAPLLGCDQCFQTRGMSRQKGALDRTDMRCTYLPEHLPA